MPIDLVPVEGAYAAGRGKSVENDAEKMDRNPVERGSDRNRDRGKKGLDSHTKKDICSMDKAGKHL